MTQQVKVRKIGNSYGVILPKELVTKLNVREGDTLSTTHTPDGIMLRTNDAAFDEVMDAAREGMREYRNTLRELAK